MKYSMQSSMLWDDAETEAACRQPHPFYLSSLLQSSPNIFYLNDSNKSIWMGEQEGEKLAFS